MVSFAVVASGGDVGAYDFRCAVRKEVIVSGMVFGADGTGILSGCASLPLMSMLLALCALVSGP